MRVVGRDRHGEVGFDRELPHGVDPHLLAWDAGFVVRRPIDARLGPDGELRLTLRVRPRAAQDVAPRTRRPGRDQGLVTSSREPPVVRQRVAAYAVVTSTRGLLATQYSDLTAVAGRWGMPGGGLDPDEEPTAAVRREVDEETGQRVDLGELVLVQSSHWVGRSPRGPLEDFHAVRLVYRARCRNPTDPVVHDQGGTTAAARWVPLASRSDLEWTRNWHDALQTLLRGPQGPHRSRHRRRRRRRPR